MKTTVRTKAPRIDDCRAVAAQSDDFQMQYSTGRMQQVPMTMAMVIGKKNRYLSQQ